MIDSLNDHKESDMIGKINHRTKPEQYMQNRHVCNKRRTHGSADTVE